jgi:hypothetical protein
MNSRTAQHWADELPAASYTEVYRLSKFNSHPAKETAQGQNFGARMELVGLLRPFILFITYHGKNKS